jgi:hypothetical protein
MRLTLLLLTTSLLAALSKTTRAALYNLQDTARPGLTTSDGQALPWWEGGPAFVLASAGAVRLNFRALYTYPPGAIVRDLDDGQMGWHSVPCNVSAWALCSSDVGQTMPWLAPRVPEKQEAVSADGWSDLGCANSAGKILVTLGVYDVSACDIFDEGLDLLYTPGRVYHRHNTLQTWKYWALVVLAVVMVRYLGYNIQVLWEPDHGAAQVHAQWPALACSVGVLLVVLLDGDSLFVTSADQVFFWSTVGYILAYLAMHAAPRLRQWYWWWWQADGGGGGEQADGGGGGELPVYNILVASLLLTASRFYAAAETPYNLVLVGVLACRGWFVPSFFFRQSFP